MDLNMMMDFLRALEQNNKLDWMHAHKPQYQAARATFEQFVQELILAIGDFDSSMALVQPKDLIFRMNRDTRFGYDKSPYHASFRAHISTAAKKPFPAGYYLCLRPGNNSFLGGGLHVGNMLPDATERVRQAIAADPAAFQAVLDDPEFAAHFTIVGDRLKRVPAGYDKEHPLAEYLKFKSWDVEYYLPDAQVEQGGNELVAACAEKFRQMKPLNDYLNRVMAGYVLPPRRR